MTFEEKTVSSRIIYEGDIFTLKQDIVMIADGSTRKRDLILHRGAVAIAAMHEGKLLMVRQFRKAAEQVLWEIPAGKLDAGEEGTALDAAKRELREETGYEGENWRELCGFYGCIGYNNEFIHLFACDATVKGETDMDDDEAIDLYEMEIPGLLTMIDSGEIKDAKTIIAIEMMARSYKLI